jgi:hypothetical protein
MNRRQMILVTGAAFGAAVATGAAACPEPPKVSTYALPGSKFVLYQTFGWLDTAPPAGLDPAAYGRIKAHIEGAMVGKGYTEAAGRPDIALRLTIGARQGGVSLDAFDTKTRQAAWRGQVTEAVPPDKPDRSRIDDSIVDLMVRFPRSGV